MDRAFPLSSFIENYSFSNPPDSWNKQVDVALSTLHQISPYIGKLKPQIAHDLITSYTEPGQLVLDPFCGSGTIPLEAHLNGRRVIANDTNPYAFVLTEAKLQPPISYEKAIEEFEEIYQASQERSSCDLEAVPLWVRQFFNERTLQEAIKFADECLDRREAFHLACFLGILHHQRPGFLSFPSSHLVPYLRDKKFPRDEYPELYEYRELAPRMKAKIKRAFKTKIKNDLVYDPSILYGDIQHLELPKSQVDAIITSPPYMNALDYQRDNRLRLWFIDRKTQNYSPEPTDKKLGLQQMVSHLVGVADGSLRTGGYLILIIGEMVVRKRLSSHPSLAYIHALEKLGNFELVDAIRDQIPDIRRSRREYSGTKAEHILVLRKQK